MGVEYSRRSVRDISNASPDEIYVEPIVLDADGDFCRILAFTAIDVDSGDDEIIGGGSEVVENVTGG